MKKRLYLFFDKMKTVFWVFVGFLTFSLLCLSIYSIYLLYSSFDKKIDTSIINWGATGDYIGGVTGTILSSIACCITLFMVYQQQKQIKISQNEIKQQQFETTFFNMLELLRSYSNKTYTDQYPLILLLLLNNVEKFTGKNTDNTDKEKEWQKYINIIKANLDAKPFLNMVRKYPNFNKGFAKEQELLCAEMYNPEPESEIIEEQIYYPYIELKNMIEKYSLFEFVPYNEFRNFIRDDPRFRDYQGNCIELDYSVYKAVLKYFNLSAFGNNYLLLADRIKLEKKPDELAKYATSPYKVVRLAVAENKYTAKETLILLSQDSEEEVRQAAINNENFKS